MDTGVARKPIEDMDAYRQSLRSRRDPVAGVLQQVFQRLRRAPKRVVFAEGEEEQVIRAAATFVHEGLGTGAPGRPRGADPPERAESRHRARQRHPDHQRRLSRRNANYVAYLYERLQRQGYLVRDVQRLINQDRNHFAACMVALDDADAMVTGVTRNFSVALEDVRRVIDCKPGHRVIGLSLVLSRDGPCWWPTPRSPKCRPPTSWRRSRSKPPASRAAWATSRVSRCWRSRPSAIRRASVRRA
jgi:malate dehydrogenase (oxaloacetate-decarboxylating)(NADP+)